MRLRQWRRECWLAMVSRLFGSYISVLLLSINEEIGYLHSPWSALLILPSGCGATPYNPGIFLAGLRGCLEVLRDVDRGGLPVRAAAQPSRRNERQPSTPGDEGRGMPSYKKRCVSAFRCRQPSASIISCPRRRRFAVARAARERGLALENVRNLANVG